MSEGVNIIRCKRDGHGIVVKLGGGVCVCDYPREECPFKPLQKKTAAEHSSTDTR